MSEKNEPKSFFQNFWGRNFLIFSFLLIVVLTIIVVVIGTPEDDGRLDFQKVLEADSVQQIDKIKDERMSRDTIKN